MPAIALCAYLTTYRSAIIIWYLFLSLIRLRAPWGRDLVFVYLASKKMHVEYMNF